MTNKLTFLLSSAILLVTSHATASFIPVHDNDLGLAPLHMPMEGEAISDSYIVVLKDHVDSTQALGHCSWVSDMSSSITTGKARNDYFLDSEALMGIQYTYDSPTWRGYSGKFSSETLEHIRRSPDVAYVEHDSMVYTSEMQRNAPWGLARISHRNALSLSTFNKYPHKGQGGEDVKVYVIDTGINVKHHDFEGRAEWGITIPENEADEDGNGHGSHCAGTIAGKRFGVAKKARPVAVKVLRSNGSGSMSGVLAGVNWATEQHQLDASRAGHKYKGSVANMSLGGGRSNALNMAVNEAVKSGMVFAVAAGNDNRNACQYSPAGAENAITVGASNIRDERAYFSNHGPCVDVFAPGENILSVWNSGPDSTNTISGTSMASPHVAGLAAYFVSLAENNGTQPVDPKKIKQQILDLATRDKLSNLPKDTTNLLIYNDGESLAMLQ